MREILFRGKTNKGKWVEGCLISVEGYCCILQDEETADLDEYPYLCNDTGCIDGYATPVIPETVGQYTGLTDKNGKKVFEGDIFKPFDDEICYVAWIEHFSTLGLMVHSAWREKKRGKEILHFSKGWTYLTEYSLNELEVIGNIHDNPELLKEGV